MKRFRLRMGRQGLLFPGVFLSKRLRTVQAVSCFTGRIFEEASASLFNGDRIVSTEEDRQPDVLCEDKQIESKAGRTGGFLIEESQFQDYKNGASRTIYVLWSYRIRTPGMRHQSYGSLVVEAVSLVRWAACLDTRSLKIFLNHSNRRDHYSWHSGQKGHTDHPFVCYHVRERMVECAFENAEAFLYETGNDPKNFEWSTQHKRITFWVDGIELTVPSLKVWSLRETIPF